MEEGSGDERPDRKGRRLSVELNHTIVSARDREESAEFLAGVLGLKVGAPTGPFLPLTTGNGVTLDFATVPAGQEVAGQHYAFLLSEDAFDASFARIRAQGLDYWADPAGALPGEINHRGGGRGCYFRDPCGHWMEIFTRGSG